MLNTDKQLQNKNALVTGASTGIGREIAKIFAANGARVALVGRDRKGLQETKKQIRKKWWG